jgi:hypothetical protein
LDCRRVAAFQVAPALALLALAATGWHFWPNGIRGVYSLTDGALAAWNSASMFAWSQPFDPSPFNVFQGTGSQYIPNTPWLNPGALALSLPGDIQVRYQASYAIYFIEALLSVFVLGRVLGLPWLQAGLAAQLYCLLTFPPFTNYFFTLPWMSLAPFNAHLAAVFNFSLALFKVLGEKSHRTNLLIAVAIGGLAAAAFYTAQITALTYLPTYGSLAAVLMIRPSDRRATAWKAGLLAAMLAIAVALDLPAFYTATARVTSSYLLTPMLAFSDPGRFLESLLQSLAIFDWCAHPQVFFCSAYPIGGAHQLALAGALALALFGQGMLRRLGIWMLGFAAFIHLYAAGGKAALLGPLNRIAADFLVFASYPFYAMCIVGGCFALGAWLTRQAGSLNWAGPLRQACRAAAGLSVVASAAIVMLSVRSSPGLFREWPIYEPRDNPILADLKARAAISPDGLFQGYTATYFGGPEGPLRQVLGFADEEPSGTEMYVEARHYMHARYGNSFMLTELWRFGVPTFEEYGQMITQPMYVFAKEVFARSSDILDSREINLHRLNIKAMQSLGIRFLITDAELSDVRLRLVAEVQADAAKPPPREGVAVYARRKYALLRGSAVKVRLYELGNPNLVSYSPRRAIVLPTAMEQLRHLEAKDFVPTDEFVVAEALPPNLVPVSHASMRVYPGSLRVEAHSSGSSALLLPLQFSNCFSVKSHLPEGGQPRLVRANMIQSALIFERQVDVTLSFQPFPRSVARCKELDARDIEKMDLSPWRLAAG